MRCQNCGAPIEDPNATNCPFCGSAYYLNKPTPPPPVIVNQYFQGNPQPPREEPLEEPRETYEERHRYDQPDMMRSPSPNGYNPLQTIAGLIVFGLVFLWAGLNLTFGVTTINVVLISGGAIALLIGLALIAKAIAKAFRKNP